MFQLPIVWWLPWSSQYKWDCRLCLWTPYYICTHDLRNDTWWTFKYITKEKEKREWNNPFHSTDNRESSTTYKMQRAPFIGDFSTTLHLKLNVLTKKEKNCILSTMYSVFLSVRKRYFNNFAHLYKHMNM